MTVAASRQDVGENGSLDLVWVQTPHVGGVLKSAIIEPGRMEVIDQYRGVSNHALNARNLCLSALVEVDGQLQIVLPNQTRDSIFYFSYEEGLFRREGTLTLGVDFERSLYEQLGEASFVADGNCRAY